nr:immunoglobulin heavy chain junction region [Mus musculus]
CARPLLLLRPYW